MWNDRRAAIVVVAAGAGLGVNACSLVVDAGREQCVTDRDCAGLGPDLEAGVCADSLCRAKPDPLWACLDEVSEAPRRPVPDQVRLVVPVVDVVTRQQISGVEVRACQPLDVDCQTPEASSLSNASGEAELRLPGGFNGYLRWQGENVNPTLFFIGAPLVDDDIFPIEVITPQAFQSLSAQYQSVVIDDRASVFVNVKNCDGTAAEGVKVSLPAGDTDTRVYYLVNGLFPESQTQTTVDGLARVINVPLGNISIAAQLADGREIGSIAVLTQPGFATLANLYPTR